MWSVMIKTLSDQGKADDALKIYDSMLNSKAPPGGQLFAFVLKALALKGDLEEVNIHLLCLFRPDGKGRLCVDAAIYD